jgi:uncharacterized integral membrane protein
MTDEPTTWDDKAQEAKEASESFLSKIRWGLVAFIVISVVVIVLSAQNTQVVNVKSFWWEAEAPLVVIILVTVLITVILDELVGLLIRWQRRKRDADRDELRQLRGDG